MKNNSTKVVPFMISKMKINERHVWISQILFLSVCVTFTGSVTLQPEEHFQFEANEKINQELETVHCFSGTVGVHLLEWYSSENAGIRLLSINQGLVERWLNKEIWS